MNIRDYMRWKRRKVRIHIKSKIDSADLDIGSHTSINGPISITGQGACNIGKYCAFGSNIRINSNEHYINYANLQVALNSKMGFKSIVRRKGNVKIGNNVWIGDNVIILSDTRIGNGAVIGAGAIVARDVPAFSVVAGVPSKVIKMRFAKCIIDQLEEIKWWNWSEEKIKLNKAFFEIDLEKEYQLDLKRLIK